MVLSSRAFTSAPASISVVTTSGLSLEMAANINGVLPHSVPCVHIRSGVYQGRDDIRVIVAPGCPHQRSPSPILIPCVHIRLRRSVMTSGLSLFANINRVLPFLFTSPASIRVDDIRVIASANIGVLPYSSRARCVQCLYCLITLFTSSHPCCAVMGCIREKSIMPIYIIRSVRVVMYDHLFRTLPYIILI